jgi:hypothetical protein
MEVYSSLSKSSINGGFPIVIFDYVRQEGHLKPPTRPAVALLPFMRFHVVFLSFELQYAGS